MQIRDFPWCCTAQIIYEFSENQLKPKETQFSVEAIKQYCISKCAEKAHQGWAMIVATTTDEQENANEALSELGWKSSGYMSKTKHKETKVKLWWIALSEFKAPENYVMEVKSNAHPYYPQYVYHHVFNGTPT